MIKDKSREIFIPFNIHLLTITRIPESADKSSESLTQALMQVLQSGSKMDEDLKFFDNLLTNNIKLETRNWCSEILT